jgi:hypothetical protein
MNGCTNKIIDGLMVISKIVCKNIKGIKTIKYKNNKEFII